MTSSQRSDVCDPCLVTITDSHPNTQLGLSSLLHSSLASFHPHPQQHPPTPPPWTVCILPSRLQLLYI